jgi:uncharacterized protein (TIGR03435 family)
MCARASFCVVLLAAVAAFGQAAPATQAPASANLTFDVASVHAVDMSQVQEAMKAGKMPKVGLQIDGLRAEYNFMSLQDLIAIAYKVKTYQISGPDWLAQGQSQARFNIAATMPEGAAKDDTPAMLQALLQERFKLVAHLATQDQPVLALVMGKAGPKMKDASGPAQPIDLTAELKPNQMKMDLGDGPMIITRSADGSSTMNMGEKGSFVQRIDMQAKVVHIEADHLTMDGFADLLNRIMGIGGPGPQVVNMTGLAGNYQLSMELNLADLMAAAKTQGAGGPDAGGAATTTEASDPGGAGSTVYAAVQKDGLKLERRKAPVQQLVVDHVEKTPTDN